MKAFQHPQASLGNLDARSAAALITAAADICLVIDDCGTICDISCTSDDFSEELRAGPDWIGRSFASLIAEDTRGKVDTILQEAYLATAPKWRHLNHVVGRGVTVPVLYCALPLHQDGRVVAFGRDLRAMSALQQRLMNAQQSMERDYLRLRDVEMRYRLLFHMSAEAVLILDAGRMRVVEANPAARRLLSMNEEDLIGQGLPDLFDPASVQDLHTLLDSVRAGARTEEMAARMVHQQAVGSVVASMFRQDNTTFFLLRITPQTQAGRALTRAPDLKATMLKAVEQAPDGFVVTDTRGQIITANAAFLDMAQLAAEEQARGEVLDRWLGQSSVDLNVMIANLKQRGSVRFFATSMRGEYGVTTEVEVSAVSVANDDAPCYGFAIRNVGLRMRVTPLAEGALPRSAEQLGELIGRVALKDLVREATDVIEKLCIEAALKLANDNRASAAEMLGLSRQSLYVKLRRYGLGDLAADGKN